MELVWSYLFNDKMRINPREKKVLLTDAPMNPRENRWAYGVAFCHSRAKTDGHWCLTAQKQVGCRV